MQLNLSTDYAIRCLLHLTLNPNGASAQVVGRAAGIQALHAQKILSQLKKADLVTSSLGSVGGFTLSRPPEEISLFDIVQAMERTVYVNRCLEEDHFCSLDAVGSCPVRRSHVALQKLFEDHLRSHTLASLSAELKAD